MAMARAISRAPSVSNQDPQRMGFGMLSMFECFQGFILEIVIHIFNIV